MKWLDAVQKRRFPNKLGTRNHKLDHILNKCGRFCIGFAIYTKGSLPPVSLRVVVKNLAAILAILSHHVNYIKKLIICASDCITQMILKLHVYIVHNEHDTTNYCQKGQRYKEERYHI